MEGQSRHPGRAPLTTVPHGDTIAYYWERLPPESLAALRQRMVHRLIRMKALDPFRLFGHLLVAVDGTGRLTYSTRQCPHGLTQTHEGTTTFFPPVLEAKRVPPSVWRSRWLPFSSKTRHKPLPAKMVH